ncbi:MAG: DUF2806 domain-containing protein [Caldilineaceae bacterium]|nr:DUF2806 domain-containing protein [Caldilineaceae bacterium]
MVEIVLKVPAIEKLVDYTASGIGATAGPLFRPWQAYMEGHAKRISARADADALAIIAKAQAEARQYLVAPEADVQGAVEISHDNIMQRIEFQERKRLANIASVVGHAAEELSNKEVPHIEPDHDWTARFFDCVQDVSSEHMQRLWAKVLSGEVESPGRTSLRTLETLRNMTKGDAALFERIAGFVIEGEFIFYNDKVAKENSVLGYATLLHLEDCGLINVAPSLARSITWKDITERVLLYHRGALVITKGERASENLEIPAVLLTTAGREFFRFAQGTVQMAYLKDLATFLDRSQCQLSLLKRVKTLPDGRLKYSGRTPIEPRPKQPGEFVG